MIAQQMVSIRTLRRYIVVNSKTTLVFPNYRTLLKWAWERDKSVHNCWRVASQTGNLIKSTYRGLSCSTTSTPNTKFTTTIISLK